VCVFDLVSDVNMFLFHIRTSHKLRVVMKNPSWMEKGYILGLISLQGSITRTRKKKLWWGKLWTCEGREKWADNERI